MVGLSIDASQQPKAYRVVVRQVEIMNSPDDRDAPRDAVTQADESCEHVFSRRFPPGAAVKLARGPVPMEGVVVPKQSTSPREPQMGHPCGSRELFIEHRDVG